MSDAKRPCGFHYSRIAVLLALLALPFTILSAQDSAPDPSVPASSSGRIVPDRPPLYSFKRDAHPLTWVEWGSQPLFRSADNGFVQRLLANRGKPEKPSGVKFDLGGVGAGSGLGPEVTFYNKNFLGRGINL